MCILPLYERQYTFPHTCNTSILTVFRDYYIIIIIIIIHSHLHHTPQKDSIFLSAAVLSNFLFHKDFRLCVKQIQILILLKGIVSRYFGGLQMILMGKR